MEMWVAIKGFEGLYSVSNLGRIKRDRGGRIKKLSVERKTGYLHTSLNIKAVCKRRARVHVFVAEAFLGDRPKGYVVDHINQNKQDNRIENLRYVSPRQNSYNTLRVQKLILNGLRKRSRIFTNLEEIKKDISEGKLTQREIAVKYGFHYSTISRWVKGNRRSGILK